MNIIIKSDEELKICILQLLHLESLENHEQINICLDTIKE